MRKIIKEKQQKKRSRSLAIRNVHASVDNREIVKGVSLSIRPGEIHLLVGPNGSGKSTLLHALVGHPRVAVRGSIVLNGVSLAKLSPHERSRAGLFLGFQQPVDIPGVTVASFLRTAVNAVRTAGGKATLSPAAFVMQLKDALTRLGMDERFGGRILNAGLSGGEKKRGELLQMVILQPCYALLDEFDSGLDIDALREVARVIVEQAQRGVGFLLVSHNPKLGDLLPITAVYVMSHGAIGAQGGRELLETIAKKGFTR